MRDAALQPAALAEPGFGTVEANWFSSSDNEPSDADIPERSHAPLRHSRESGNPRRGSPLGNPQAKALTDIISRVRNLSSQLGATAIVQRCPPDAKAGIDVWGEDHPGIDVMRRMKSLYDPNRIMNPGRFVGRI